MAIRQNYGVNQIVSIDRGGIYDRQLLDSTSFDPFGSFSTYKRTLQIGLKSAHGLSNVRDVVETTNGGTVTNPGPDFQSTISVACDSTANSTARFETLEWGRYQPGFASETSIGVNIDNIENLQGAHDLRWGYFNATDGMGFGVDTTGVYVFYIGNDLVLRKTYQSDWNIDKLDGTGPSKNTLDISKPALYNFEYSWYGFMNIEYSVISVDPISKEMRRFIVHRADTFDTMTEINPNVSVAAYAMNGVTAAATPIIQVSYREYSVLCEYNPHVRYSTNISSVGVSLNSTTWTPLMSIRKKSTHSAIGCKFDGYDILAASSDIAILVMLNTTLTGGTWGNLSNTSPIITALEANNTATIDGTLAVGPGDKLYSSIHPSGNVNNKVLGQSTTATYLGSVKHITIMGRALTGTATATLLARFTEEW